MKLVPVATSVAEAMSQAIWQMQRPPGETGAITTRFCDWVVSEKDPAVAFLMFPDALEIPLWVVDKAVDDPDPGKKKPAKADVSKLEDIMGSFVTKGDITRKELNDLKKDVGDRGGKRVDVHDLVPPSWRTYVMTKQQAEAGGFIKVHQRLTRDGIHLGKLEK